VGRSHTYNVIGEGPENDGVRLCYPAMNKREMEQARVKAGRDGKIIERWCSQTVTGARMLGFQVEPVRTADVKLPKLVSCPICSGRGCVVCNDSGVTSTGYEKNWQSWQLDQIRQGSLANQPRGPASPSKH